MEANDDNNSDSDGGEWGLTADEIEAHRRLIDQLERKATDYGLDWHTGDIDRTLRWCGEYSADWVLKAIDRASMRQKRSWALVQGILRSWKSKGVIDDLAPPGAADWRPPVITD